MGLGPCYARRYNNKQRHYSTMNGSGGLSYAYYLYALFSRTLVNRKIRVSCAAIMLLFDLNVPFCAFGSTFAGGGACA